MSAPQIVAPPPPRVRLSLGVTGHREMNSAFAANRAAIEATLISILDAIDAAVAAEPPLLGPGSRAPTRLHSLLVEGLDQIAAREALDRSWELVVPLPFGRTLNLAINANPETLSEARFLLGGSGACGEETRARAARINALCERARLFELADRDAAIAALYLSMMSAPKDVSKAQAYSFEASKRVALAAQVMVEQSDLIIGVWDGATTSFIGGTGHTIAMALDNGAPVIWIDARAPQAWRILRAPESLAVVGAGGPPEADREKALTLLVQEALKPAPGKKAESRLDGIDGLKALDAERWKPRSNPVWHGYRRIEALFGANDLKGRFRNLTQVYEVPDAIATGSAAGMLDAARALPGQEASYVERVADQVLRRFAWADGISARLSDTYRGGMVLNFIFSALAIVGGIAYLPFTGSPEKWVFSLLEVALLVSILVITFVGNRLRWHARWFETRRVAEYFRHAPLLLMLGVARPTGRWPQGAHTSWPEWYARHGLRDIGLPQVSLTSAYLLAGLRDLLLDHVTRQGTYHVDKAQRLARTHRRLDKLAQILFVLAVAVVSSYLALRALGALQLIDPAIASSLSTLFSFLGVMLPTFGGVVSGIRFFGDFERFSAISEVTAEKLETVATRIELLLTASEDGIDFARVADLAHAADDIVVSEIESWQAVFGGKHVTVPA